MIENIKKAAELINKSKYLSAFTGAGISVESGIPSFRGPEGIWNKYDPKCLDLDYYYSQTEESWKIIKEIFYEYMGKIHPNPAHHALAILEKKGILKGIITQNIDNLHQEAGNKEVYEFHGNMKYFVCNSCNSRLTLEEIDLNQKLPLCNKCGKLLKPDFIFFGEGIPETAYTASIELAQKTDVMIVVGSTGEVMPACHMPVIAKQKGATIIEINPGESTFKNSITDIHIEMKGGEALSAIMKLID
jgi:NAD-dependent deacetylase